MKQLKEFLEGYEIFEKRSALYYLARYIKQAKMFETYQKDIFEDVPESKPNQKIKSLVMELIKFIESTSKKKASEFTDTEFYFWMDEIAEIEDNIDNEPSKEQIQKALNELNKFEIPHKE